MKMEKNTPAALGRRGFLRLMGLSGAALAVGACTSKDKEIPTAGDGGMSYRVNHNTGDTVSLLGYGCMRLPTKALTTGADDDSIDQEAVNRSVDAAIAAGVNYFDTSPAYCKGRSEEAMGIALSRHPRDSYYLATKLSNFAPSTWPHDEGVKMFENSLRYLRTDYVDYLLLHAVGGGGMETLNNRYFDNGMLDYLVEQKKKGRIRNLGFSYHGDIRVFDHLLEMMDRGEIHWDFVQIQFNYMDWAHAKETNERNTEAEYLYNELHRRNIPAVVMEPLLGGRLASVPPQVHGKMKQRRPDDTPAAWAFRYAGSPEGILTVLSGMTYMEHLYENINTYSPLDPVTEEESAFLERVAREMLANDTVPCTACQYCMPCPYGIDIPAVFAHYNKCIKDDNLPRDTRDPDYARARRAFLVGYDRTVPRLRQADRCIECCSCVSHCPQGINIPDRLTYIDKYVQRLKVGKA